MAHPLKRYDLSTPEGTRDLLYQDCLLKNEVINRIEQVYHHHGYAQVETPILEFYDVFTHRAHTAAAFPTETLYKLTDTNGRLLVVRPDSTTPIARMVATRLRDAQLPLRLYYHQTLYSSKRPHSGHSDAFIQMGAELIGSNSMRADLEMLTTALEVLETCDSEGFILEIGDISFFKELISKLSAPEDTKTQIRQLIEDKNYPALNDILDGLEKTPATLALKQLPRLFGGLEVFDTAAALFKDEQIEMILGNLKHIYTCLEQLGLNGRIRVDLGMVNRVDYYTGLVMRGYLEGYGQTVLSGGRYDRLLADFGYDIPATGFAVNVDAVMEVMRRKSTETAQGPTTDCLVYGAEGEEISALIHMRKLNEEGTTTEYSTFDTIDESIAYAHSKGIKKLLIIKKGGEQSWLNVDL